MKKTIIGLLVVLVIGYFGYNYIMAAPKNIKTSNADYKLQSDVFSQEFTKNLSKAEKKYTDKVILIKGKITQIEDYGITIDNKIFCKLPNTKKLKNGEQINVKGLFIGYDELFELIKLDQGSIITLKKK
jgi:hypothetical protein